MNRRARPWRAMALLAGSVLALHLAVLEGLSAARPVPASTAGGSSFRFRHIEPAAPPPAADPRPAAAPEPARSTARRTAVPSTVSATPAPSAKPAASTAPVPPSPAASAALALAEDIGGAAGPGGWDLASIADPMRLHYQVNTARQPDAVGSAQLDWRHDGRRYEAALDIAAPGAPPRHQRSSGAVTAQGLAPERFADRVRSEQAAHFDRGAGRLVFSTNRPGAGLLPGAQDRLSVLMQLGGLLAAAPPGRLRPGQVLALQTAGTREAAVWRFQVEAEEDLQLPGGTLRAWRLVRPPRHEWDLHIQLWLAPGQAYAPVRLRLTPANGEWLDLQWLRTDKG
ncbi:DUF3108 domain-containing protein [Ramlibacter tataouinensis]|uniref:DUF3108 domain-containing protein n=1 Tax=Ramlibacter tataouinensis (strain ATCC BAA-407 / DSM 14655 / LMG 21543 / TTB310) TaxID=365046 RepID=F5Y1I6_RAMTT|nr:DUF3108 domain-containing protein [Ramlibacter tataouinensis]AEG94770.1 Conserved hypothetical protein [Ramlibacter tataouinensis TTB310]